MRTYVQTLEESKAAHFSEEELANAQHHNLLFLDILLLGKGGVTEHKLSVETEYTLMVEGSQCQEALQHLWKNAKVRVVLDNSLAAVHAHVPAAADRSCMCTVCMYKPSSVAPLTPHACCAL